MILHYHNHLHNPEHDGVHMKMHSQEFGKVLISLFEFLEEFPEVPGAPETYMQILELKDIRENTAADRGNNQHQQQQQPVYTLNKVHAMYNDKTMMEILMKAADMGNGAAQNVLASVYATGVLNGEDGLVPMDAGRSLMLHYTAALSGNAEANVAMGYRFANGIGVQESCTRSLQHYEFAANVAMEQIESRGFPLYTERSYLSNEEKAPRSQSGDSDPEVVQYYQHLVSEGDVQASLTLGRMYMHGNKLLDQDLGRGAAYLKKAADGGSTMAMGHLGYTLALGLGGDTQMEYSNEQIAEMLRVSNARGDPFGVLGYGYVHLKGIGVARNHTHAWEQFTKASAKHPDAHFYMGEMLAGTGGVPLEPEQRNQLMTDTLKRAEKQQWDHQAKMMANGKETQKMTPLVMLKVMEEAEGLGSGIRIPDGYRVEVDELAELIKQAALLRNQLSYKGGPDMEGAIRAYGLAAARGHVGALHRLSHMTKNGMGVAASCSKAVQGFRVVAEAGDWVGRLTLAHRKYSYGSWSDQRDALRMFSRLAPLGYETAQYNAAHILSRRIQPGWYRLSQDGTSEQALGTGGIRLGAFAPPRAVSLAWLPWAPWKFSQVGIPEPTTRLLSHREGPENERIINHNAQADRLKSQVSAAATAAAESLGGAESYYEVAAPLGGGSSSSSSSFLSSWHTTAASIASHLLWSLLIRIEDSLGVSPLSGSPIRATMDTISSSSEQGIADFFGPNTYRDSEARALNLYALSANQGNADSRLRLGDFHYYGLGWLEVDKTEAAEFYQSAADLHHTHAIFNLGVMYEAGDGVKQDFHLAKRFYDQAAEFSSEAKLPRTVALFVMQMHQSFRTQFDSTWLGDMAAEALEWVAWAQHSLQEATHGHLRESRVLTALLFSTTGTRHKRHHPAAVSKPQFHQHLSYREQYYYSVDSPYTVSWLSRLNNFFLGDSRFTLEEYEDIFGCVVSRPRWVPSEERARERWIDLMKREDMRKNSYAKYSASVDGIGNGFIEIVAYVVIVCVHNTVEFLVGVVAVAGDVYLYFLRDFFTESWLVRGVLMFPRLAAHFAVACSGFTVRYLIPSLGVPETYVLPECVLDLVVVAMLCLSLISVQVIKDTLHSVFAHYRRIEDTETAEQRGMRRLLALERQAQQLQGNVD
jgi:TPR repeat protein